MSRREYPEKVGELLETKGQLQKSLFTIASESIKYLSKSVGIEDNVGSKITLDKEQVLRELKVKTETNYTFRVGSRAYFRDDHRFLTVSEIHSNDFVKCYWLVNGERKYGIFHINSLSRSLLI